MISRSTLVGALVVAELVIVGVAAEAVSGHPTRTWTFEPRFAHGRQPVVRLLDKTFATGPAPHVVIDVDQARVAVIAGPAGTVHVAGTMTIAGHVGGAAPSLDAVRTADGVRVAVESGLVRVRGRLERQVQLTVPADATVQVASAGDVSVSGLRGALVARVEDGDVRVVNHRGDVDVSTDSGNVELLDVQGRTVALHSDDGTLKLSATGADRLDAQTSSGAITAAGLRVVDGALRSSDGAISVSFAPASDAAVSLHTDDGAITGGDAGTSDEGSGTTRALRLGTARGHFNVSTADGSIAVRQGASV
ncbi:MAG TPA: DUF4097 family beta strand repeat-containing protein [Candidatus Elarobacter sp.]|nr:DUF4097 family beta strand repeat-containing protein [Candidatus Elarobacter sp.]